MRTVRTVAEIVVGLGFGDEGKGTTIDWLARRHPARLVVRFNGGAQAGHHVVLPDGRHHCFSQFGSGTFAGAETHLSRYMIVNPVSALSEEAHLAQMGVSGAFERMTIEEEALVTTPFQVAANRLREMYRTVRHGSCGMGIGETVEDSLDDFHALHSIRVRHLLDSDRLRSMLRAQQERKRAQIRAVYEKLDPIRYCEPSQREWEVLNDPGTVDKTMEYMARFTKQVRVVDRTWLRTEMTKRGAVLFEGAQGVLLDENFGFHPHTTWSDCTFGNALRLLEGLDVQIRRTGVLRAFHTRHGAGPFVSEREEMQPLVESDHNCWGPWQSGFRAGVFDMVAAKYAVAAVGGVDGLAMTCLDQLNKLGGRVPVCVGYTKTNGRTVKSLALPRSLGEQEALTQTLFKLQPVFRQSDMGYRPQGYAGGIAEALGVPLRLASTGPTHEDKTQVF